METKTRKLVKRAPVEAVEPKRRGRPKGTKMAMVKSIPAPTLSSKPVQATNRAMLKVRNSTKEEENIGSMVAWHEHRLAHVKRIEDMDESDVTYLMQSLKHLANHEMSKNKGTLLNEYLQDCYYEEYEGNSSAVQALYEQAASKRAKPTTNAGQEPSCGCGGMSFVVDTSTATRVCVGCGSSIFAQESKSADIFLDERLQVLSKVSYQRVSHFREWLASCQGRQSVGPAVLSVIELVKKEIKKERIADVKTITLAQVRKYLASLRLGRFYEYTPTIYARVTGHDIMKFPPEIESALLKLFEKIQPVFDSIEKNRKNFLSYSFTMNKLLRLLNYDTGLEFFPLLKSREKLLQQDALWRRICLVLDWPFMASV